MFQTLAIYFVMLIVTSTEENCGDEGYKVTNYRNRGYLKLYKKLNNSTDCFKCWRSGLVYKVPYDGHDLTEYSDICDRDPAFYQVTRSLQLEVYKNKFTCAFH